MSGEIESVIKEIRGDENKFCVFGLGYIRFPKNTIFTINQNDFLICPSNN